MPPLPLTNFWRVAGVQLVVVEIRPTVFDRVIAPSPAYFEVHRTGAALTISFGTSIMAVCRQGGI